MQVVPKQHPEALGAELVPDLGEQVGHPVEDGVLPLALEARAADHPLEDVLAVHLVDLVEVEPVVPLAAHATGGAYRREGLEVGLPHPVSR